MRSTCLLSNNATGGDYNTAVGYEALSSNTTAMENTAIGMHALGAQSFSNVNTQWESDNVAIGSYALGDNKPTLTTNGISNTAVGVSALGANTIGSYNTAIGQWAGAQKARSNNNTFVGYGADVNANNLSDMTAIGNGAIASATYNFVCGDVNVNGVFNTNGFFAISDGRFKINITENVKGLEFINKLRPVTYNLDTKSLDDFIIQNMPDSFKTMHQAGMDFATATARVHSGFIAQEVEQAAHQVGFTSSIVTHPVNSNDAYALRYEEIVVPLVKAVQELSHIVDSMASHSKITDSLISVLQNCCVTGVVQKTIQYNENDGTDKTILEVKLSLPANIYMSEAYPNPNNGKAEIDYYLPSSVSNAQIIFTDMLGKVINEVKLVSGYGTISVDTKDLANGNYTYSLVTDGKVYDTKKMIRSK